MPFPFFLDQVFQPSSIRDMAAPSVILEQREGIFRASLPAQAARKRLVACHQRIGVSFGAFRHERVPPPCVIRAQRVSSGKEDRPSCDDLFVQCDIDCVSLPDLLIRDIEGAFLFGDPPLLYPRAQPDHVEHGRKIGLQAFGRSNEVKALKNTARAVE